jgi:hypothetical protein|tara:strand:+ start:3273 stop:3383 length:111 start_codon:yes stop_codon:yes gene_type:complete
MPSNKCQGGGDAQPAEKNPDREYRSSDWVTISEASD